MVINSSGRDLASPRGSGAGGDGGIFSTAVFSTAALGRMVGSVGRFLARWVKCGSFYFWLDLVATLSLMFGESVAAT